MRILRGVCNSNSSTDKTHRVEVTVEGICSNLLMDTNNGLYLRKGDIVYVYFADDYNSPLVIGRCGGQLELQDLVDTINGLVEVFNNHTHYVEVFKGTTPAGVGTTNPTLTKQSKTSTDKLLY